MKEQIERLVQLYTAYMNSTEENEDSAQAAYLAEAQRMHELYGYDEAMKINMAAVKEYQNRR